MCEKILGNCQQLLHLGFQAEFFFEGEGGDECSNTGPEYKVIGKQKPVESLEMVKRNKYLPQKTNMVFMMNVLFSSAVRRCNE